MHLRERGLGPLERRDVDEAGQVVDAEADLDLVARGHLDLVLRVAGHSVGEVLPGRSLGVLVSHDVESIRIRVCLDLLFVTRPVHC